MIYRQAEQFYYLELLKLKIDYLFNTNQISSDVCQTLVADMDKVLNILNLNNDRIVR